ncbi:hypothetical protein TRFO_30645 [Tritrichomonas foetus]|uniref:SANT domain-containing protein n=1 Tax=Tritrichomonas foetus TaxID=1144522 RepID=A0A1J4JXM0_9EUKA|nr:hypothetical protein TRFO_30645 [Tritrichomonas foetus]|eukprot:OHT02278.1 hypothetical protein TRFO_30645 [Tritrichomonas foetus]
MFFLVFTFSISIRKSVQYQILFIFIVFLRFTNFRVNIETSSINQENHLEIKISRETYYHYEEYMNGNHNNFNMKNSPLFHQNYITFLKNYEDIEKEINISKVNLKRIINDHDSLVDIFQPPNHHYNSFNLSKIRTNDATEGFGFTVFRGNMIDHSLIDKIKAQNQKKIKLSKAVSSIKTRVVMDQSNVYFQEWQLCNQIMETMPTIFTLVFRRKQLLYEKALYLADIYYQISEIWQELNHAVDAFNVRTHTIADSSSIWGFEQSLAPSYRGGGIQPAPEEPMILDLPSAFTVHSIRWEGTNEGDYYERKQNQLQINKQTENIAKIDITDKSKINLFRNKKNNLSKVYLPACPPFIYDKNMYISDPVREHKIFKRRIAWTSNEQNIFYELFNSYPKKFSKITSFLPGKETKDVIEFYYSHRYEPDMINALTRIKQCCPMSNKVISEGKVRGNS